MIYHTKPEIFKPKFEVVGSFIQSGETILLLHRQNHKPQGGTWGIPSGKIDAGEKPLETASRETREETGLVILPDQMKFLSTIYVKYDDYDFIYHMYHAKLASRPEIILSHHEHQEARWVLPAEAFDLPLIEDMEPCLEIFMKNLI